MSEMVVLPMSGLFAATYLVSDEDGGSRIVHEGVSLQPGRKMTAGTEDVLIAGGFSSFSPETGFPLSPTLQLNSDLGRFSDQQLQDIALAELDRVNAATFRSYLVEPDNRLCVLGDDSERLEQFSDQFGGVLDIETILLKGNHPEIPTAVELDIDGSPGQYRLRFAVRSPVDKQKCTYCGDCGPACPESCLDEGLQIDFDRCTACKECETACPQGAIDIHGIEERELVTPALLLIGGVELEFEGDDASIYREEQVREFLASLYSFQVDEVISWSERLCQYSAKHGFGCSSCEDICPHGAISRGSQGVVIDPLKCEECGGCLGVCPTGAIRYERFADSTFVKTVQALPIASGATLVVGSEDLLRRLWWKVDRQEVEGAIFLEFNRVSGLSLFHLLFLFAQGIGKLVLLSDEEDGESRENLNRQTAIAASLVSTYCEVENRIVVASPQEFLAVSGNRETPLFETTLDLSGEGDRRRGLAAVLSFYTEQTGRQARIKENRELPFARVSCDADRCTQCYACLNECRIQALHTDDEQLSLRYVASLCVGCAVCVRVCPENALSIVHGATLDEGFFGDAVMAEAEPIRCKECGKAFGTRKSYERVMEILSRREGVDTSHFEYCDTCRVVKLFEQA